MESEKHDQLLLSQTINSYNLMDYRPHFRTIRPWNRAQERVYSVTFPVRMLNQCWLNKLAVRCCSTPEPPGLQGHTIIYSWGLWSWTISDISLACLWVITGSVSSLHSCYRGMVSAARPLHTHILITPIFSSWKELSEMQCEAICEATLLLVRD